MHTCTHIANVTLTHASSTIAVLAADSMDPVDLFDAGRHLLRAWTAATAVGYSTHPISVVIDRPETRPELAAIAGVRVPVALFRVGYTRRRVPWSNRRPLHAVLGTGGRPGAQADSSVSSPCRTATTARCEVNLTAANGSTGDSQSSRP